MKRLQKHIATHLLGLLFGVSAALANPVDPVVVSGSASFQSNGSLLEISNSPGTIINWQDFSIAEGEITRFVQQSDLSAVLNRVTGGNLTEILGSLQSNGQVFVINPAGLVIGEGAVIDTAGFVASTLDISDESFKSGSARFAGDGGDIVNNGVVHVTGSGDIILVAPSIENSGILRTDNGDIVLAAGRSITLSFADLDYITFDVQAANDEVLNLGKIIAGGGNAALHGGRIIQRGGIELVESADGKIFLEAQTTNSVSGDITAAGGNITILGENIELADANLSVSSISGGGEVLVGGDYQGGNSVRTASTTSIDNKSAITADSLHNGDGGRIIIWSDLSTKVSGTLTARGGELGGNGGFIETSSLDILDIDANVSVMAPNGQSGQWLLDPEDIVIDSGAASSIENTLNEGGNVTVKTADGGTGEGNITVEAEITKTAGDNSSLTLDAHNRIVINARIRSEFNELKVNLKAGRGIQINAAIDTNGGSVSQVITGGPEVEGSDDTQTTDEAVVAEDVGSENDNIDQSETGENSDSETATEPVASESGQADDGEAVDVGDNPQNPDSADEEAVIELMNRKTKPSR